MNKFSNIKKVSKCQWSLRLGVQEIFALQWFLSCIFLAWTWNGPLWPKICCSSKRQFWWQQLRGMARYAGKKCQNGKNFFPPGTVNPLAWWWAQKNLHFLQSGQSLGFKVKCLKKWHSAEVFGQVCSQWVIFFWHFSLLVPERPFSLV